MDMDYTIDKSTLYALVNAEVSQVADAAYGENGMSLYDTVVLTEKDDDVVDALLEDGIRQLVRTTSDIASRVETTSATEPNTTTVDKIAFSVPDFDTTNWGGEATALIDRFIVLYVCAAIFQQRRAALVPEYTNRAQAALDNAVTLLRKRKTPSRTTS